jgi:hypothetical protein
VACAHTRKGVSVFFAPAARSSAIDRRISCIIIKPFFISPRVGCAEAITLLALSHAAVFLYAASRTPPTHSLTYHAQSKLGNKWSEVARHIPGRTGQQCAQRWRHKVRIFIFCLFRFADEGRVGAPPPSGDCFAFALARACCRAIF